jgi:hypothetical protein
MYAVLEGIHMTVKEQAIALRREKKSYREITAALGISKGTLSGWFNRYQWSEEIRRDLEAATRPESRARITAMSRARSEKFAALRTAARVDARTTFPSLIRDPLFAAGIALYWGEGSKNCAAGIVRLANVDPRLIKVFINFLIHCCAVPHERLRAWVLLYPDLDTAACHAYWSAQTGLPSQQFRKAQVIIGRAKNRRLRYGVCSIETSSRLLCERIDEWTQCAYEYLSVIRDSDTV